MNTFPATPVAAKRAGDIWLTSHRSMRGNVKFGQFTTAQAATAEDAALLHAGRFGIVMVSVVDVLPIVAMSRAA